MAAQVLDAQATPVVANASVSDVYNSRSVKLAEATRVKLFLPGLGSDLFAPTNADVDKGGKQSDTALKTKRKLAKMQGLVRSVLPDPSGTSGVTSAALSSGSINPSTSVAAASAASTGFGAEIVVILEDLIAEPAEEDSNATEGDEGEECEEPCTLSVAKGAKKSKADAPEVEKVKVPPKAVIAKRRPIDSGRHGHGESVEGSGTSISHLRSSASRVPQIPVWRRLSQQPDRTHGGMSARERASAAQPKVLRAVQGRTISLGLGDNDDFGSGMGGAIVGGVGMFTGGSSISNNNNNNNNN
eukprot:CAMPEP_0175063852 /NCGR_PEP_ID=MMETSP0052_2-20121109/14995_1 /TAXON_ID=51329 ORGANISM="Polytomella parva, Strain SAG 63-3" /NCGR_SAMPLE_ID=MMETSP0052_2 /ASSEMBLY_ACC=CAM_ASM_000194 /LENGTH=299 /DNA_ID=CAMNT_0016330113 /DNA_START=60 /DNA_END=956 /DNA_ORIENTATION=-